MTPSQSTDDLVKRLPKDMTIYSPSQQAWYPELPQEIRDTIERLQADLAARDKTIETLREDAERWQHAVKHGFPQMTTRILGGGDLPKWKAWRDDTGQQAYFGDTLNAAIDAARSEGGKP